jgi:integrase
MASVNVARGRLYLLAKVPRRDGAPGLQQTRIALKMDDTPTNQRTAQKLLQTLEKQLASGSFDWSYWSDDAAIGVTWREAIARLYRKKVVLGRTSESTWEVNYMGRLRQIPQASTVTTESIAAALQRYDRGTCSYKELWYLLQHLARLVGVPFPELPVPTYGQAELVAVPTDEEILDWLDATPQPARWYLAMAATYGLRPHEIEGAVLIDRDYCQVAERTKTGFRTVVPLPREWVERFQLHDRQERTGPRISTRPDAVSKWLSKVSRGVPWRAYALRHAWAARLWREGGSRLDIYTAARLMGHNVATHSRVYRSHIQPHAVAEAAERALGGG